MGLVGKVGDLAFKAFTVGLGGATVYLTVVSGINVYRGLSWHNAQTEQQNKENSQEAT